MTVGKPLTQDEIHTIRLMRRESQTIDEIAKHMGLSRSAVGDACKGLALDRVIQQPLERIEIPEHVLAERDRRLAMQPRDLTAALMGDPVEARHGR